MFLPIGIVVRVPRRFVALSEGRASVVISQKGIIAAREGEVKDGL